MLPQRLSSGGKERGEPICSPEGRNSESSTAPPAAVGTPRCREQPEGPVLPSELKTTVRSVPVLYPEPERSGPPGPCQAPRHCQLCCLVQGRTDALPLLLPASVHCPGVLQGQDICGNALITPRMQPDHRDTVGSGSILVRLLGLCNALQLGDKCRVTFLGADAV